jgi:hypothetical protein
MVRVSLQTVRMLTGDPVLPWELDWTPPLVALHNVSVNSIQLPEWTGIHINETSVYAPIAKHILEVTAWFKEPVIIEWCMDMASQLSLFAGRVGVLYIM